MRADTVPLTSEELHAAAQSILPTTEAEAAANEATDDGLPCVVVRRGSDWVTVQGRKPRFTGGHTGIPWGSFGVFDEPYDEATARATVEKVRAFWYKTGAGDSLQHEGSPLIPSNDAGGVSVESAETKSTNGVCSHSACAKRPFCLVARLAEAKNMYHEKQVFERKVGTPNTALSPVTSKQARRAVYTVSPTEHATLLNTTHPGNRPGLWPALAPPLPFRPP